jgi:hypothetical protein
MPEIGTSGSMSGDGKRSVAEWPKLSLPSSTLPSRTSRDVPAMSAMEGLSDVKYSLRVFRMLTHIGLSAALVKASSLVRAQCGAAVTPSQRDARSPTATRQLD